jgi:UDP-2,4-diacetamido-2,4,6-trideoxy-beta-L-altropyranose hydrolase
MTKHTLLIRADANKHIGTGHVMRCLALAEAWQDAGGEVCFVSACDAPALEVRLKKEGFQILHINQDAGTLGDANETARIAHEHRADWIIVDGYHFGAGYQKTIKDSGLSLLVIDDYGHSDHYYADIVLNQNIYADMSFYLNYEPYTRFLLGTKYALIRKEFLKWSGWHRDIPKVARKILVTLGGGDPDNVTQKVIEAVKTVEVCDFEVIVVAGGFNPHIGRIEESIKNCPEFRLIKNADNMPELMAWADVAISAGGSTSWELAFMGLPSVLIPIAENQKSVVNELQSLGIAHTIENTAGNNPVQLAQILSAFLQSREIRSGFSERMVRYIDGKGPLRILHTMSNTSITLRNVEPSDCKRIWGWINDPLVRSVSFDTRTISLQDHKQWFSSVLNDPNLVYYIALDSMAIPVGQARFKITSREAEISVLVDPNYRGLSLGSQLIRNATEKLFAETEVDTVKALIKTGNDRSRRSFIRAGYKEQGLTVYCGEKAYLLIKIQGKP